MFTLATKGNITICSVRNKRRFFSRSYIISEYSIKRVERMTLISTWNDDVFGVIKRYSN